jgi:HK97 family phage portal protein
MLKIIRYGHYPNYKKQKQDNMKNIFRSVLPFLKGNQAINNQSMADKSPVFFKTLSGFASAYDALIDKENFTLAASLTVVYYRRCAPLHNAIDMIAQEVAGLKPLLFDTKKEVFIKDHPILELLQFPNADIVWEEFIYNLASFFLLSGNAYILATGRANKPPLEINVMPSQVISISPGKDGYAQTYTVNIFYGGFIFERKEVDNRFRYYSVSGDTDGLDREFYHIKNFNPISGSQRVFGMSKLNPIYYEIEQYINQCVHNLSILERGARPAGLFMLPPGFSLTDDQLMSLRAEINNLYSGASNAGRVPILEGGMEFIETMKTNRDMDFLALKKEVTAMIYNTLRIPLPLITSDNMTYSNFENATLKLYDNAVIPLAKRLFSELSYFLLPRYPNTENLILAFDEGEVLALEPRRNEQLKVLKEVGIFTLNEMRNKVGALPLDGGDVIYGSGMGMPIATDPNTESGFDVPALDDLQNDEDDKNEPAKDEDEKETPKANRKVFVNIMRGQINRDGTPRYTDDEILRLAQEMYAKE